MPASNDFQLVEVTGKALLDVFIRLPNELHSDDPNWTIPLMIERRDALNRDKNPFFDHATAKFWLLERNGRYVGRISAQIDQMAITQAGESIGHFGLFACDNDPEVGAYLLKTAESWLREQGMSKMQGPMSLSINQEVGLMVEGFDTPSMMIMPHDQPYLRGFIEQNGFETVANLSAYIRNAHDLFPDGLRKLAERDKEGKVSLRTLDTKRYAEEIETLMSIFNEGWHTNWGFVPMTDAEIKHTASELRPIIVPELTCFAEINGKPAGFMICVPDINEMISGLNGKLFPFGWLKLLWRMKVRGPKAARVMLLGIKKEYAGSVLGKFLPIRMIYFIEGYLKKSSIERVEMGWVLDTNRPMRRIIERVGGMEYKKYKVYEKAL